MEEQQHNVTVVGNYLLGGLIGKGTYGKVYKGLDSVTGKFAAIKILKKTNKIIEIKTEVEILKNLIHPNIITYLGCGTYSKKSLYIVFEYAENGSLKDVIRKFGPLKETLVKRYIQQVLSALEYLNQNNVLHLDLKAANILITKNGVCKLADFGSAHVSDENYNDCHGTFYWMAPEVFDENQRQLSHKSDIWSLGCTVVELLTGDPPFKHLPKIQALHIICDTESIPELPKGTSDNPVMEKKHKSLLSVMDLHKKSRSKSVGEIQSPNFNFLIKKQLIDNEAKETKDFSELITLLNNLNEALHQMQVQNASLIEERNNVNSQLRVMNNSYDKLVDRVRLLEDCSPTYKFLKNLLGKNLYINDLIAAERGVLMIQKTAKKWAKRLIAVYEHYLLIYKNESDLPIDIFILRDPQVIPIISSSQLNLSSGENCYLNSFQLSFQKSSTLSPSSNYYSHTKPHDNNLNNNNSSSSSNQLIAHLDTININFHAANQQVYFRWMKVFSMIQPSYYINYCSLETMDDPNSESQFDSPGGSPKIYATKTFSSMPSLLEMKKRLP